MFVRDGVHALGGNFRRLAARRRVKGICISDLINRTYMKKSLHQGDATVLILQNPFNNLCNHTEEKVKAPRCR